VVFRIVKTEAKVKAGKESAAFQGEGKQVKRPKVVKWLKE
jgi:hypothetical protein